MSATRETYFPALQKAKMKWSLDYLPRTVGKQGTNINRANFLKAICNPRHTIFPIKVQIFSFTQRRDWGGDLGILAINNMPSWLEKY